MLAAGAALSVWPGVAAARSGGSDEPPVTLPKTFEQVWYKTSKKWFSAGGDLTITREALEFTTGKKTVSIPMDEVYVLSYGQYKSDVDTEWAVLGIGKTGPARVVAIRDGKKLGYGGRTLAIYETLKAALREVGAGQYRTPPGFTAFDKFDGQCSLAVPEGWDTHLESLVVEADGDSWGTTIFSSEEIEHPTRVEGSRVQLEKDPDLERVLSGEIPAFILARREVDPGMRCDGFSSKARRRLVESETRILAAEGYEILEGPDATPVTVGFCNGLNLQAKARRPDGRTVQVDSYAAANEGTLFVLALRARTDLYEEFREPFHVAVSTLKFAVAK